MKKLIIPILAITAFVSLSACRTDDGDRRGPYVRHVGYEEDRGPRYHDDRGPGIEINTETHRGD
jgi:hypothetical protein